MVWCDLGVSTKDQIMNLSFKYLVHFKKRNTRAYSRLKEKNLQLKIEISMLALIIKDLKSYKNKTKIELSE